MKYKKAMLLYNGEAGQNDLEKILGACIPVIASEVEELVLIATQKPGHAKEVCKERGEEMDAVFVLGGDGTVHEAVNGIAPLEKRPVLGILPNGTCNDFSRSLNIPQNIKKAAQALMDGDIIHVDAGRVNDSYFLNFWGIGLIAETSNNIDPSQKKMLGKMSYFLSALRTINEVDPFPFKLTYDGKNLEDSAVMILILNGHFIGTNSLPFPNIQNNDGLFDIVVVKNSSLSLFREIISLTRSWPSKEIENSELIYLQASKISVETEKQMDADSDGEIYLQTPAEIVNLKQHLKVISVPLPA
ncbi:YegS/Rv2252/BmrU family lipid kinase [Peribacillus deserti]|uniref:YegS/Rv2252/BmrU family lipid kinase n=1 Tax=Peribacillus deserti TaxID=673318 RepID=A0ABS2QPN3_9BACI|nr:YegS/Rv2252/BmrU family lipid kinase [Peribacillus deserti]MBM7694211.1 YegS/Rv2252/BmrU family lipid kinase [Peribacillus deserti]